MKKKVLAALVVALMLGIGAIAVTDRAAAAPSEDRADPLPGDRVRQRSAVELVVKVRYDPRTRGVRVLSKSGRARSTGRPTHRVAVGTRAFGPSQRVARASYTCLVRRDATRRLRPGNVLRVSADGRSYSLKYLLFPYTLNRARTLGRTLTRQIEFCVTGGGDVWNGFHQWLNGASVAYASRTDRTIGTQWGTEVVDGAVSSTISLKIGGGPVSIGASTTVADKDRHTGSTGRSGDVGRWDQIEPYNPNRVNTFYKSGTTWRWQGSADYQGNNGHLLVEVPQGSGGAVGYVLAAATRAHCKNPFGIGCGDFD